MRRLAVLVPLILLICSLAVAQTRPPVETVPTKPTTGTTCSAGSSGRLQQVSQGADKGKSFCCPANGGTWSDCTPAGGGGGGGASSFDELLGGLSQSGQNFEVGPGSTLLPSGGIIRANDVICGTCVGPADIDLTQLFHFTHAGGVGINQLHTFGGVPFVFDGGSELAFFQAGSFYFGPTTGFTQIDNADITSGRVVGSQRLGTPSSTAVPTSGCNFGDLWQDKNASNHRQLFMCEDTTGDGAPDGYEEVGSAAALASGNPNEIQVNVAGDPGTIPGFEADPVTGQVSIPGSLLTGDGNPDGTQNALQVLDNHSNVTPDPTCANQVAGTFTVIDVDESAGTKKWCLCGDTTVLFCFTTSTNPAHYLKATATSGEPAYGPIIDTDMPAGDATHRGAIALGGDLAGSGGTANNPRLSIDSVTRDEIDESQVNEQTHATDCSALACNSTSKGEKCTEEDSDVQWWCNGTTWVVQAAPRASYLMLGANSFLTNERDLVTGAGIAGTDGGAGGSFTLQTASTEAGFVVDGNSTHLTCSSTTGKMQVLDDGSLEWCDGAGTLQTLTPPFTGGGGGGDITAVGDCATGSCYQSAPQNQVYAGPASGGAGQAAMRALVAGDLPSAAALDSELDTIAEVNALIGDADLPTLAGTNAFTGNVGGTRVTQCVGRNASATADAQMSLGGVSMTNTIAMRAMRAGSVTAMSVQFNVSAVTTGGTIDFETVKNGTAVYAVVSTISTTGDQGAQTTQARGTDTFAAGDLLNININFTGFAGTIATVIVCVELVED